MNLNNLSEKNNLSNLNSLTNLTLLLPGFLTNDYSRGGSLGPRSYSQLILTSFWTRWTIIDQFTVKGAHQWSCEKKNLTVPLKIGRFIPIFLSKKNFSKFLEKFWFFFEKLSKRLNPINHGLYENLLPTIRSENDCK